MKLQIKILLPALTLLISLTGCQDPWEDRIKVNTDVPVNTVMEEILARPELSQFALLLQQTGWDTILNSTKAFTVFAPTNDALGQVSSEVLSNPEELVKLVNNHICFLQYEYLAKGESDRVKTFNNKYITLDYSAGMVEDASLIDTLDIMANNGVLHKINKPLVPRKNVWEFIENTSLCPKLTGYINSLTGTVFDASIAKQIGVDPETGRPIYDTASGLIWNNSFINRTRELKNEEVLSTVVLFSDNDFETEFSNFRNFYKVYSNPDQQIENTPATDSLTTWKIVKDIVFPGKISPEDFTGTLVSTFGINVPVGNFTVDSSFEASNGMVYIVSGYNIPKEEKIPTVIVEGEDTNKYVGYATAGYTGYTRERALASGGYDFVLDNHQLNPGTLTYYVPDLCNMHYKVYIKVVNDFRYSYKTPNDTTRIRESVGWTSTTENDDDGIPIFQSYNFVVIGDVVTDSITDESYETALEKSCNIKASAGQLINGYEYKTWLQVRGTAKNSTLALDYIKLVPQYE